MRHSRRTKKFDRHSSHRQAMLKNLAKNLLIHQKIKTTLAKAKEGRRLIEKLITLGKKDTVNNRRSAYVYIQDRKLIKSLFEDIAPLFKNRPGGYTRVLKTANRNGDGAQMAILELVVKSKAPKLVEPEAEAAKEEKKVSSATKAPQKEKPKIKPKPVENEAPKPKEKKRGFVSGLRKYFGGRRKNLPR